MNHLKIIVALDFTNEQEALEFVDQLDPTTCRLKVGKAIFTRSGPAFVKKLISKGFDIFLDLKFYDIPHQVNLACRAATELGVWMIDVHALGGKRMLQAAREGVMSALSDNPSLKKPLLIAVTILTSFDEADLLEIGLAPPTALHVLKLAQLTQEAGLEGVVCSAQEASILREKMGPDFTLVTPGIRLKKASHDKDNDDQRRIVTPTDAIQMGADYLVVGRPITQSDHPMAVINEIQKMILVQ